MMPRAAFRSLRRQLYWDDLDFIYFGGYATWNCLLTPFLFLLQKCILYRIRLQVPKETKSRYLPDPGINIQRQYDHHKAAGRASESMGRKVSEN